MERRYRYHQLSSAYSYGYAWFPSKDLTWNTVPTSYDVSDYRDGENQPLYRTLIAQGQDATTTFSGVRIRLSKIEPYDWYCQRDWPYLWIEAGRGQLPVPYPSDPQSLDSSVADNQARRKVTKRIYEKRTQFLGASFAVEIRDTIRMLRSPARALREGLDAYHATAKKRSKGLNPVKTQKVLAETWLEYQFGWKPLVSDIESAVENLTQHRDQLVPFKASAKDVSFGQVTESQLGGTSCALYYRTRECYTSTVTYRGALRIAVPNGMSLENWGLGTQDFLPAVWEAIPWSFAVDYFTNIGDIINGFSLMFGNVAWVNKTVRRSVLCSSKGQRLDTLSFFSTAPKIVERAGSLGCTETTRTSVNRNSVSVQELIPAFELKLPGVGSTKWLNLAALARLRTL